MAEQTLFYTNYQEYMAALASLADSYRSIRVLSKSVNGITIKCEEPMAPVFEHSKEVYVPKELSFLDTYKKVFGQEDFEKILQTACKDLSLSLIYKIWQEDKEFFMKILPTFSTRIFALEDIYTLMGIRDEAFLDIFVPKMSKHSWTETFETKMLTCGNEYLVRKLAKSWGHAFSGSIFLTDVWLAGMKNLFFDHVHRCSPFSDLVQNFMLMTLTPEEAQEIINIVPLEWEIPLNIIRRAKLLPNSEFAKLILKNAKKMNPSPDTLKCL